MAALRFHRVLVTLLAIAGTAPLFAFFITSEDDGKTYRAKLGDDRRLTSTVFAERGGTSVVSDPEGNV